MFEAIPFQASAERSAVVSKILRSVAAHETIFSDFQRGNCDNECYRNEEVEDMCSSCRNRMELIARLLVQPDALAWEVWDTDADVPELVGLMRISRIIPGADAVGHYVFFDGDLRGKTEVLRSVINWLFEDHEELGWRGLQRLTVEIPDFAHALARHASRKLGFGGDFEWKPKKGAAIAVEGVKRGVVTWRGQRRDLLIMGLQREDA